MGYRLNERIAIRKRREGRLLRELLLLIVQMVRLKRVLILFPELMEIVLEEIKRECGEKVFRPKVLVVASLAECALSSHFSSLFRTYMIKIDL